MGHTNNQIATSTRVILARLAMLGIPASARNTTSTIYNWERSSFVDIIAHGIVQIEAKICNSPGHNGIPLWTWNSSSSIEKDDIVILVDKIHNRNDWYVFLNTDKVFYHPTSKERGTRLELVGSRKRGLVLGERNRERFELARERWELIEQVRLDKCRDIATATLVHI